VTPERFRECLARLRYSSRSLADVLGCHDRLVRRWGSGHMPIPPEVARWLETGANVPRPEPSWSQRPSLMPVDE